MDCHHLQIGLWNHLALCRIRNGSYVYAGVCVWTCVFVYYLGRLFRLFTADKSALLFIKKKRNVPAAVCLLSVYKAGRRQQPEGLHWSPLWKWRCESLTEIVCSLLLVLYADGAEAPTVCQLLTPLMPSVCVPRLPLSAFRKMSIHQPCHWARCFTACWHRRHVNQSHVGKRFDLGEMTQWR